MKLYLITRFNEIVLDYSFQGYALVVSICFSSLISNEYLENLIESAAINTELFGLVAVFQKHLFHV